MVVGLLVNFGGWCIVFWVVLVLMVLMVVVLWCGLLKFKFDIYFNYLQLLGFVFSLFIYDKLLCICVLLGCLIFVNFSIFWMLMVFLFVVLLFSYFEGMIGLFGLVGVVGVLGVCLVGGFVDKGKFYFIIMFGLLLLLFFWLVIWFGYILVLVLIIGILVLDFIVQGVYIINQMVIYCLYLDVCNWFIVGYMISYFIGGVVGLLIFVFVW